MRILIYNVALPYEINSSQFVLLSVSCSVKYAIIQQSCVSNWRSKWSRERILYRTFGTGSKGKYTYNPREK